MRIPTELHRDPLYPRSGQNRTGQDRAGQNGTGRNDTGESGTEQPRSSRSHWGVVRTPPDQSWRRVIRLVVVLVLVLVLMREAARPAVYEIFFPGSAQSVVSSEPLAASSALGSSVQASSAGATSSVVSGRSASVANQTTHLGGSHDAVVDSQWQSKAEDWASDLTVEQATQFLVTWLFDDLDESTLPVWAVSSKEVSSQGQTIELTTLAVACRKRMILGSKDGTVWRAADVPALSGTLATHHPEGTRFHILRRASTTAEPAGVLPLLQQPSVYRGRSVIARGDVVRIERVVASPNPFRIDHYWNLWLMPKDASARPWLVIVSQLPAEMVGLVSTSSDSPQTHSPIEDANGGEDPPSLLTWSIPSPFPTVNVNGEFLKRLSYQSAAGAELTPVVVGHVETVQSNGNPAITVSAQAMKQSMTEGKSADHRPSPVWILAAAVGLGILFSGWVMWRTAALNRQLRQRRSKRSVTLQVVLLAVSLACPITSYGESVMDLLPGFDESLLQAIVARENENPESDSFLDSLVWDEASLSKLLYRFNRLSDNLLKLRRQEHSNSAGGEIGDAIALKGEIVELNTLSVPNELSDVLDIQVIQLAMLDRDEGGASVVAFKALPVDLQIGDKLSGSAAVMGRINDVDVLVAGRLTWSPAQPASPAGEFLSSSGVDLSRLPEIAKLDRKPLSAEDSPVFFRAIGAAKRVANGETSDNIARMRHEVIDALPIDLLKSPAQFTGQWIRLKVESVRMTRIAVESPERREQVGGDHYYQIDAIGDLGNVQLKIEVPDGEPVMMENRYPVTIVTGTLPDFLTDSESGTLVSTKSAMIRVEGFFYRLWSYESDLMKASGGKQFAPLIIGGVIEDLRPKSADPIGVGMIGKIAAVGVIAGIVGVIFFGWFTRRGDRASRKRRYADR